MTQEEKELLLKDLCARLPYGISVLVNSHKGIFCGTLVTVTTKLSNTLGEVWIEETDEALWCDYKLFKPYLRPMSSMTEEEKQIMANLWKDNNKLVFADPSEIRRYRFYDISVVDFLNSRHLDYRGLIPKGLALEASEGMYNIKHNN